MERNRQVLNTKDMQLFLYLMTTTISLVWIMENDATPLMSLLDGTILETYNRSTGNYEDTRRTEIGNTSKVIPTRLSKMLNRTDQDIRYRIMSYEEERKRIKSLWDPVLNQSYDFTSPMDYDNSSEIKPFRISKKLYLHDQESTPQDISEEKEPNWTENSLFTVLNEYPNSRIIFLTSMKLTKKKMPGKWTIVRRLINRRYRLRLNIFLNKNIIYGERCSIFTTLPRLGYIDFVVNLTVDTNDYLIKEFITAVNIKDPGWGYTNNLRSLLRSNGILDQRLYYNRGFFYRTSATFYSTEHKYIIGMISALKRRSLLMSRVVRKRIEVQKPPGVDCLPSLHLEFCSNPEEPVEVSPLGHMEFFATIGDECHIAELKSIHWGFYDTEEINSIAHVKDAAGLVVKLLPYKLNFVYDADKSRIFILRGKAKINDITTVARCYVTYKTPELEPTIKGNERRNVDIRKSFSLDGSSSKDRVRIFETLDSKDFFWSCQSVDDPANPYCHRDMSMRPSFKMPPYALKEGAAYEFKLTVISRHDPQKRKTFSQIVKGITKSAFTPEILCRRNCYMGVYAPVDSVHLIPKCDDCPGKIQKYEWWVMVKGERPYLESRYKYLILQHSEAHLSIRLKVFLKGNRWAEAFYTLRRNDGPTKGTCDILPTIGLESLTIFEIECLGFESPHSPLSYRFTVPTGVVASNVPYTKYHLTLPATKSLSISICDTLDMCVDEKLNLLVLPIDIRFVGTVSQVMADVPKMFKHGHWNKAYTRAVVATKWISTSNDGSDLYSPLRNEQGSTGSQLEQLSSLATHMLTKLTPIDYKDAIIMGELFSQISDVFTALLSEFEWLHRDAYYSLTAAHMYFMSILGKKSEPHSLAMCKTYDPECLNFERLDFETNFEIEFDPLILLRINSWMMNTWYLYKCVYFLGVLATKRHHPYDDALNIHMGGIAYQINVTEVTNNAKKITLSTIDNIHVIQLSKKLLFELKKNLNHSTILFQTISQQNHHNIFWWYPDPLPSKTSVLIMHAYSPVHFFVSAAENSLDNPLVYKTNISLFNDESLRHWMANSSIQNSSEIHIYSLMLNTKAMLAVRIVSCSELMYVKMRLHRWPTLNQIRQRACHITPDMNGKRIWMANSCSRSRAYVAIHRPGIIEDSQKKVIRMRANKYKEFQERENERWKKKQQLNYSILLEIYQCNFWKNRSLDPGWSKEFCTTTFEHSYGTSVQCTCHTLGTLSSRIFPISAELIVEHIPVPEMLIFLIVPLIFLLLFVLLILKCVFNLDYISAHLREPSMLHCESNKGKVDRWQSDGPEILLVIRTGGQEFAGTTSNIKFYFKSRSHPQTSYQITQDPGHPKLVRNSTNILVVPRSTIYIPTRLSLGITRNGRYPSWYCRSVTVLDLELNIEQLFVVERWIERGHTHFMRSKYFSFGAYHKFPKYTWCKRFRIHVEKLYVSWFMINAITGPWHTDVGGITMNRFERTCVLICKTATTLAVVTLYFGKSTVESIQEETRQNIDHNLKMSLVAALAFYAFIVGTIIHFLFEFVILRWLWPQV
ncbi:LOW QUALITY PROTEIN: uncharacterized protein LOC108105728 [Drosophila eugracilis]|uniref:LOW QUALITY PROTEIN: uncharacterized protein LOC108105728 n=1 Tax=Drosophila eugracilis TaxID=29029 RepID=UPI001BDB190A|nr:LOW QUALITY PROTEIN: uncharacterized protein LOC108105728 [Drosophila eugracilis]